MPFSASLCLQSTGLEPHFSVYNPFRFVFPADLHQIKNEWGQSKYPMVPGGASAAGQAAAPPLALGKLGAGRRAGVEINQYYGSSSQHILREWLA